MAAGTGSESQQGQTATPGSAGHQQQGGAGSLLHALQYTERTNRDKTNEITLINDFFQKTILLTFGKAVKLFLEYQSGLGIL